MVKGRFIMNPFPEMQISPNDQLQLQDLANSIIMTNLDNYNTFVTGKRKVDTRRWKKIKEREKLVVYAERPESAHTAGSEPSGSGIPMILLKKGVDYSSVQTSSTVSGDYGSEISYISN
ncbi:hypothetical protein PC112_g18099 [Phytophthora cactorum]|nr:hypothetical protein PC112_g18099 [Phytophthora cactorum]